MFAYCRGGVKVADEFAGSLIGCNQIPRRLSTTCAWLLNYKCLAAQLHLPGCGACFCVPSVFNVAFYLFHMRRLCAKFIPRGVVNHQSETSINET